MKHLVVTILGGALMFAAVLAGAPKNPNIQLPGEAQLTQEVRHYLLSLPYYSVFDALGFRIEGNTVVLEGEVTRPILKSDAEHAVEKIEGVGNVLNNIEVLPLSPNDDLIRRATFRAIYGDPDLSVRYGAQAFPPIHIIVKNGNVRLQGVVVNQMDKTLVGMRANGVPGAFGVENDLQVEGK